MVLVIVALLGICFCGIGCGTTQAFEDYRKAGNPRKEDYVIGVGDILKISVWKMPEVNSDAHVRPDGNITLPLIGEVKAAGRTTDALRADIQNRLAAYVKDGTATVTVGVLEVNSYTVTVSGKVMHPGVFNLKRYVTVSEAIAMAGGPTLYANPDDTVIIRTWKTTKPRRYKINYSKINAGEAPDQDLVLYSGDTVWVP